MIKHTFFITSKKERAKFRVRFSNGKAFDFKIKTEIEIETRYWNTEKQKFRNTTPLEVLNYVQEEQKKVREILNHTYVNNRYGLTRQECADALRKLYGRKDHSELSFFEIFSRFMETHQMSYNLYRHFAVLKKCLKKWEEDTGKPINIHTIDKNGILDFKYFIAHEKRMVKGRETTRGLNTVICMMNRLKMFFVWANGKNQKSIHRGNNFQYTSNNPFAGIGGEKDQYRTEPVILTKAELDTLKHVKLNARLSVQRDVFLFQCFTGCRVGDMLQLKKEDVVNGSLSYIPNKTLKNNTDIPTEVSVPLTRTALEILERYAGTASEKLLPFISAQKYNEAIKEIFTEAGLTRNISMQDPHTWQKITKPLNEIASSHLARRTFCGLLFETGQDISVICSMSGHAKNSRSFARYHAISENRKRSALSSFE